MKICVPLIAVLIVVASACVSFSSEAPAEGQTDSDELKRLFEEDQADRRPEAGKSIDWSVLRPRDEAREQRVKEMLADNALKTGADFYHAAMVLQHGGEPDDYLLCHDLCIVAISKGEMRAKWLAAAPIDRFLVRIGRPQRFGTQFHGAHPRGPMKLREVDPNFPDELRRLFNVPPISEARKKEAAMNAHLKAPDSPPTAKPE